MPDTPHEYVPPGPLNSSPGGGYRDPEIRREALAAVLSGAETGDWDEEVLDWLARLDDSTCRTIASLLWRARLAGQAEAAQPPGEPVTEWAVQQDSMRWTGYPDEARARETAAELQDPAEVAARHIWAGPWTVVPEPGEDEGA